MRSKNKVIWQSVYLLLKIKLRLSITTIAKAQVLFIFLFFKVNYLICQEDSSKPSNSFDQQDITDWLAKKRSKPPPPTKNSFLLIVPYVSSNPTAGFMLGGGLTFTYKKNKTDRYLSVITASASYSTNKLVNTNLKSNLYIAKGKINLNGDWRFLINNETTYGLGTDKFRTTGIDINGVPTEDDTTGQALKYHQLRFYETASFKLFNNFFGGVGFHYDRYYNIIDDKLKNGDSSLSIHYQFSKEHGFNYKQYTVSGVSLNLLFDSRDNQVNAYQGYFVNINYRINLTALGSEKNNNLLLTEYRSFHSLDGDKRRHILGLWLYGNFEISGSAPYLALPALGYDQRQRTGRGYKFGQFRGNNLVYGEGEYRFPISRNTGILGGVIFLNATSASDKNSGTKLMDYVRLGYGGGLRIMVNKQSRTRIAIDIGLSPGATGFYFGAQEAF